MATEECNDGGDESTVTSPTGRVKFFCSHGGKILPRPSDGTLKYVGGETRVVAVPRCMNFSDLMKKINDQFDGAYVLKYQISSEDLDSLVSVKSDEDIYHFLDEYDRREREGTSKLRTFLVPIKPTILENQTPHAVLGPLEQEQRSIDATNSIVRPISFCSKPPPLNNSRLKSFSPSPTEASSPQSLSPRGITNNSGINTEKSLLSSVHNRHAPVPKVQSSPSLCNLGNHQNCGALVTNGYIHQQPYYFSNQQYQHYHHGYQSPNIPQDHHIQAHHGYQSPTLQDHHNHSHHGYQSPTNPQDHHMHPLSQPLAARGEYGMVPFAHEPASYHNPSNYHPLLKAYPGSGGHNRWGHLEQYANATCGTRPMVTADSLTYNAGDTWE